MKTDVYATIYIQALNDYMLKLPMKTFLQHKLQRIYNYGRFIQTP